MLALFECGSHNSEQQEVVGNGHMTRNRGDPLEMAPSPILTELSNSLCMMRNIPKPHESVDKGKSIPWPALSPMLLNFLSFSLAVCLSLFHSISLSVSICFSHSLFLCLLAATVHYTKIVISQFESTHDSSTIQPETRYSYIQGVPEIVRD